jgi:hypothetical protein
MRAQPSKLQAISDKLVQVRVQREELATLALDALECQYPSLAQVLLQDLGSRRRAALWMCTPQRICGGETPCALLAAGDEDRVWDLLADTDTNENDMRQARNHMAY